MEYIISCEISFKLSYKLRFNYIFMIRLVLSLARLKSLRLSREWNLKQGRAKLLHSRFLYLILLSGVMIWHTVWNRETSNCG